MTLWQALPTCGISEGRWRKPWVSRVEAVSQSPQAVGRLSCKHRFRPPNHGSFFLSTWGALAWASYSLGSDPTPILGHSWERERSHRAPQEPVTLKDDEPTEADGDREGEEAAEPHEVALARDEVNMLLAEQRKTEALKVRGAGSLSSHTHLFLPASHIWVPGSLLVCSDGLLGCV